MRVNPVLRNESKISVRSIKFTLMIFALCNLKIENIIDIEETSLLKLWRGNEGSFAVYEENKVIGDFIVR